jgi:hypothetical protein
MLSLAFRTHTLSALTLQSLQSLHTQHNDLTELN